MATKKQTEEVKTEYPSGFYQSMEIAVCPTCGEKLRTRTDGQPLCPIAKEECDRNVE